MVRKSILSFFIMFFLLCGTTFCYGAADPAVTIVNPINNSTTTSSNVLISVKVTQPKVIRISLFEQKQWVNGAYASIDLSKAAKEQPDKASVKLQPSGIQPVSFATKNNLTFCTKQINGLKPGLYKVKVDTMDRSGRQVLYSRESNFGIYSKEEPDAKAFENEQSGTSQFLQKILKSIFGS